MAAATTSIIWGEHGGVPGMANDVLSNPQSTTGLGNMLKPDDPSGVPQSAAPSGDFVAEPSSKPNQSGVETGWRISSSDINAGPTNTQQPQVGLASPTDQASSVPVAVASSSGGSNLSEGAVAGIAIAALILGAALSFIAAFILFKRRTTTNQKAHNSTVGYNNNTYTDSTPELVMLQKPAGRNSAYIQVSQTPLPAPTPIIQQTQTQTQSPDPLATILPSPAHDTEIQNRITALFSKLHRHIDVYYRDVHASITPSMAPELLRFGAEDVDMAELLQDCASPTTALKHALGVYVLRITGSSKGGDDGGWGLWPGELSGGGGGGVGNITGRGDGNSHLTTALTIHRRLSVYIYTSLSTTSRHKSAVREAAEHFSLPFFPWANPSADEQEKEDDLGHIIFEALHTQIWLFGQPSEFVWRWGGVGTRGVVVSPEVVRMDGGNEGGRVVLESGVVGV